MAFELAPEYESYEQVPVYRKRWFFALSILFCIPVGVVLAVTGEIYAFKDNQVMKFPANQRLLIAIGWSVLLLINILRALN